MRTPYQAILIQCLGIVALFLLSSCGLIGNGEGSKAATDPITFNQISVPIFKGTVHPILVNSCASCHGVTQAPLHALANATAAHDALMDSGAVDLDNPAGSRIYIRGSETGHGNGSCSGCGETTGLELLAAIEEWASRLETVGGDETPPPDPPNTTNLVSTDAQAVPANLPTGGSYVTMTFSLASLGFSGASISIDIQQYGTADYRIRKPRITTSGATIHVKNIQIALNDVFDPGTNTYTSVDTTVDAGVSATVASGFTVVLAEAMQQPHSLKIGFEVLESATPVECLDLNQFVANIKNSTVNNTCLNCHNGSNATATARFNMTVPDDALCRGFKTRSLAFSPGQSIVITNPVQGINDHPQVANSAYRNAVLNWLAAEF